MKTIIERIPAVLLAAVLWCSATAQAAEGRTISGPELVTILQDAGYRAELDKDDQGDPTIRTSMSGVTAYIHFYDCKQDRCGSLQLVAALDLKVGSTLDAVNKFNREYRYGRAYLDDEMDPFLAYDFEVLHAAHGDHIASQLDIWEQVLGDFLVAVGYRDAKG